MVLHTSWVKEISCLAFFNIGMFTIVLLSIFLTLLFFPSPFLFQGKAGLRVMMLRFRVWERSFAPSLRIS